jgi:hypothetical protein
MCESNLLRLGVKLKISYDWIVVAMFLDNIGVWNYEWNSEFDIDKIYFD